ncbi:MAG: hypothetical protein ACM31C_04730 [Acidobacteriota bacterium]
MSRWARAALLVVACGHAAPQGPAPGTTHVTRAPAPDAAAVDAAPPRLEDDLPRLAARAVQLFQAWQKVLADANGDCRAAATKLDDLAIEYADVIEANAHIMRAGHAKIEALKAELAKHGDEMDAAAQAIAHSPTMASCATDRAFAQAIDRIGGSP